MNTLRRACRIWWRTAVVNFAIVASSRLDFYTFFAGKIMRMLFFFFFIIALFSHTPTIAGYARGEVLLYFALMNTVDVITQLFWFRGLTDVQRLIRMGEFDFILTKPVSSLLFPSFRIIDIFDLSTVPVVIGMLAYAFQSVGPLSAGATFSGIYLSILSLVLAYAIVLALSSMNFWTTEVHNAFWIYREAFYMAQYPPEVFPRGIQTTFTYIIPLFVIIAFPTKAFLGRIGFDGMVVASSITLIFLFGAIWLWRLGLRHYSSASS